MSNSAKAEIEAISAVADALAPLDDQDAIRRVLTWAGQHFLGVPNTGATPDAATNTSSPEPIPAAAHGHETFADLSDAVSPTAPEDKALVASYCAQEVNKEQPLLTQYVNSLLNDLGQKISSIHRVFDALKARSPAPVIQLKKSGTTRQARKSYKMTEAGTRAVKQLLSASEG